MIRVEAEAQLPMLLNNHALVCSVAGLLLKKLRPSVP